MADFQTVQGNQPPHLSYSNLSSLRHESWMDRWIGVRETVLDWVTGSRQADVLNSDQSESVLKTGMDPGAVLKRALDQIGLTAMDEAGKRVNYNVLRASPAYAAFRRESAAVLRSFNPSTLATQAEELSFWINLYNALVIDGVIAFGIQRSITEIPFGLLAFFRSAAYIVGGQRVSLDDIEHGILRGNRGHPFLPGPHFPSNDARLAWAITLPDPRIHFALNCASRSCPPIQVYTPEKLDAQLDLAARSFVDSSVRIDPAQNRMVISRIFRWYEIDFRDQKGVVDFLITHLPDDQRRAWIDEHRSSLRLHYAPYDWRLNN